MAKKKMKRSKSGKKTNTKLPKNNLNKAVSGDPSKGNSNEAENSMVPLQESADSNRKKLKRKCVKNSLEVKTNNKSPNNGQLLETSPRSNGLELKNNIKLTLKKFLCSKKKHKKGVETWKVCQLTTSDKDLQNNEETSKEEDSDLIDNCKSAEDDAELEKSQSHKALNVNHNFDVTSAFVDLHEDELIIDFNEDSLNKKENGVGVPKDVEPGYNTIFFKEDFESDEFNDENESQDNVCGQNLIILKKPGQCAVPGCSTMGGHTFPSYFETRSKWMKFAGLTDCAGEHICEKHFIQKDYYVQKTVYGCKRLTLKAIAVPSIIIDHNQKKSQRNIQVEPVNEVEDFDSTRHSRCTVLGCFNVGGHLYPDTLNRQEWLHFAGRQEWELVEGFNIICKDHFQNNDYYYLQVAGGYLLKHLKNTAIPRVNDLAENFVAITK